MADDSGTRIAVQRMQAQPSNQDAFAYRKYPKRRRQASQEPDSGTTVLDAPNAGARVSPPATFATWRTTESPGNTPRSLPCLNCGRRINSQENAAMELFYEWPEETADGNNEKPGTKGNRPADIGTGIAADALIRGVPDGTFTELSDQLQRKFTSAGLGGERGLRSLTEAESFYQNSIPYPIRNLGEGPVRDYLKNKDASHITSVHNAPSALLTPKNLLWEQKAVNRARGSDDMTGPAQIRTQATNAFDASRIS